MPSCLVLGAGEALTGEPVEMVATHHPAHGELDAYERVLQDAMAGDAVLFARQDYIEEAWRIIRSSAEIRFACL